MITTTFSITLSGDFLPIQLIYGGKTSKSIPAVTFPPDFIVTTNPKHHSNKKKLSSNPGKNIIPCVEKERRCLDLPIYHPVLLIMDVFKGQKENNILLEKVLTNLTYLFQPQDVQEENYEE